MAILFTDAGPRYFGTGSPPLETYSDASLELETGDARSQPFTTDPAFFSSRALVGSLTYQVTSPSDEAPVSILEIPTASFWGLLLLALALGAGALVTLLRRVG